MILSWFRRIKERRRERAVAERVALIRKKKAAQRKIEAGAELLRTALAAARESPAAGKVLLGAVALFLRNSWERVHHFSKTTHPTMYQEAVMEAVSEGTKDRLTRLNPNDFKKVASLTGSGFSRRLSDCSERDKVYPTNVLHISPDNHQRKHPTAFPIGLPLWFIRLFTKQGDLVLDPFCGSGTTCQAAKRLIRDTVGIELNPGYYRQASEDLAAINPLFNTVENGKTL